MLNGMTMNELAAECHANNAKWWVDLETGERLDRNKGNMIMLMISELAEAMEGFRKDLNDDKLPKRKMAEVELVDAIIRIGDFAGGFGYSLNEANVMCRSLQETWEDKVSKDPGEALLFVCGQLWEAYSSTREPGNDYDISVGLVLSLILIEVIAKMHGFDLEGAYNEKTAFNKVRKDHTKEGRLAAGGKKW